MDEISKSRLFDPTTLPPIRLSPAAVHHLAAELKPSKASPLTALLQLQAEPSPAELDELGIPHAKRGGGASPSAKGKAYRQALETLAAPEQTVFLSEIAAGTPPMTLKLVMGLERVVLADVDTAGLQLSPPMSYPEFVKSLARHFENTLMFAEQRAFWPSQLRVLTGLFSADSGAVEPEATGAALKARFEKVGIPAAEQKQILDELVASKTVVAKPGGAYAMSDNTAFWLTRMGTGQIGELLCVLHDEQGSSTPSTTQLRFVGPPKDRVTMVTVSGEELKGLAGDAPPEPAGVVCQVMDRPTLTGFLEAFLGVAPA